jgi:uncharacterized membrane protein
LVNPDKISIRHSYEEKRLKVAREVVDMFFAERVIYLVLSIISAAVVIFTGWQMLQNKPDTRPATLGLLFGTGGVVTFNLARLLTMFNTVIDKVFVSSTVRAGSNDANR